jgi:hypothetical protein
LRKSGPTEQGSASKMMILVTGDQVSWVTDVHWQCHGSCYPINTVTLGKVRLVDNQRGAKGGKSLV